MFNFFNKFKYFDLPLQICVFLLVIVGLALLYSVSFSGGVISTFWRQVIFAGLGLVAFVFFSFFDYHNLAKSSRLAYLIFIVIFIYVLVFGALVHGSKRWIDLGFFRFQPAEFIKIIIILGLARLLYLKRGQINSWSRILWSFCYVLLPAALILLEPDLGSTIVILGLWAGLILISPVKKKFLAILLIAFIVCAGISWKFFLRDFQKSRVEVFLNPQLDPQGRGYNVKQAAIAVGSGEIFGSGFGKGSQSLQNFLPEMQTDFIFAAVSQEIGLLGDTALLALYAFLFYRLIVIMRKAKDDLGMYITAGVLFLFFFHVVINVGMNIGLLPVTGIPLPFVSSGGSNLLVVLIALGITQNIAMQSKVLRF